MKVLICDTFGGFSLSRAAFLRLRELGCEAAIKEPDIGEKYDDGSVRTTLVGIDWEHYCSEIARDDPLLLQVFEEMGQDAAGTHCHLAAVELPEGVSWHIEEYDGNEHVAEDHRTWR